MQRRRVVDTQGLRTSGVRVQGVRMALAGGGWVVYHVTIDKACGTQCKGNQASLMATKSTPEIGIIVCMKYELDHSSGIKESIAKSASMKVFYCYKTTS